MKTEKTIKKNKITKILVLSRKRLSNINNWCSDGNTYGRKRCLYATVGTVSPKVDSNLSLLAASFITKASKRVIGRNEPLDLNDGKGPFEKVPATDRWKLVKKIISEAVKLSRK